MNIMIINRHVVVLPDHFDGPAKVYGFGYNLTARRIGRTMRIVDIHYSDYTELKRLLDVVGEYANILRIPLIQVIDKLCDTTVCYLFKYGFIEQEFCGEDFFRVLNFEEHYRY